MESNYVIKRYTQDNHPVSHFHEFYEVFISLSNQGKFFVREQAYPLTVGEAFFLRPFEIHHCFCHGSQEYDRFVVQFSAEHLRKLSTAQTDLTALFNAAPVVQQLSYEQFADLIGRLSKMSKPLSEEFGADIERNLYFDMFLLKLAGTITRDVIKSGVPAEHDQRINEIISYIHSHYAEEITLESLSGIFYISKSRLSQIFKNTTGFSIGNYIIIYRIKRACTLLAEGESVQNVGRMVGFNNNTHFIRMFKKQMGCSPGRFLKSADMAAEIQKQED